MKKNKNKFSDSLQEFFLQCVATIPFFILCGLAIFLDENFDSKKIYLIFNICVLLISPVYYMYYAWVEKVKTRKLEKKIIQQEIDYQYYRYIINEYPLGVLSLVYDGNIEIEKDLFASMIFLIRKNYLRIENSMIYKTDKSPNDLSYELKILYDNYESMILKQTFEYLKSDTLNIKYGKYRKLWLENIEKAAIENGLLVKREEYRLFSLLNVLCAIVIFLTMTMEYYLLAIFSIVNWFILIFSKITAYDRNKFVRTQKGEELHAKLVGLKRYVRDFSDIEEEKLKKVYFYDEYILYAIIFNEKNKLIDDLYQTFDEVGEKLTEEYLKSI